MSHHRIRTFAAATLIIFLSFAAGCGGKEAIPNQTSVSSTVQTAASSPASSASAPEVSEPQGVSPSASASASALASAETSASPDPKPSPASESPKPAEPPSKPKPAEPRAPSSKPEAARTATLFITGNAEWGSVLAPEEVPLRKNDTVADVLVRTLKAHKLAFDASGSGPLFYVQAIDGLFEFDDGPTSGWKYRVNGSVEGVGAGSYILKPGDRVEWFYTSKDKDAEEAGKEQSP